MQTHTTPSAWVDPDDAPELSEAFFEAADFFDGEQLLRPGHHPGHHPAVRASQPAFDAEELAPSPAQKTD